jgi:hypothetical protein
LRSTRRWRRRRTRRRRAWRQTQTSFARRKLKQPRILHTTFRLMKISGCECKSRPISHTNMPIFLPQGFARAHPTSQPMNLVNLEKHAVGMWTPSVVCCHGHHCTRRDYIRTLMTQTMEQSLELGMPRGCAQARRLPSQQAGAPQAAGPPPRTRASRWGSSRPESAAGAGRRGPCPRPSTCRRRRQC